MEVERKTFYCCNFSAQHIPKPKHVADFLNSKCNTVVFDGPSGNVTVNGRDDSSQPLAPLTNASQPPGLRKRAPVLSVLICSL
jgi:hypothetical protein